MDSDDLINSFFNFASAPAKRQRIEPANDFKRREEKREVNNFKREDEAGTSYAAKHQEGEELRMINQSMNMTQSSKDIIKIEDSDDEEIQPKEDPELPELMVYDRYQFNLEPQKLPILRKREEILQVIGSNSIVVLTASTGTGKSSQVPQYILEMSAKEKKNCNIIVTQPRRIAAITIAERVAIERKCEVGSLVGYQVGLDRKMDTNINSDTRILFCTTGVLVQKLINQKTMKHYTHVILDEVHERDVEMDMLLIIIRRLFSTKNPYIKIIIMSATLNASKISEYFKTVTNGVLVPAPILDLNIQRKHPIEITYLDKLEHLGAKRSLIHFDTPGIESEMYAVAVKTMGLVLKKTKGKSKPSFLVFLPGIHEINRFRKELGSSSCDFDIEDFTVTILHSSIATDDFRRAFDGNIENRIILATNIAESSITLPGVRFVIDFCLTKYQQTDTATNMTQLKTDFASKMSMEQRAGRVGRTEVGQVIRMLFKDQFQSMPVETIPEMQRISLEAVVLKAKQLDDGKPPFKTLALAMDPPPQNAVTDSILVLKEIGGLTRLTKKGDMKTNDGDLTFSGTVMAKLPVDVRISKLIILGYLFSCLEECIIIGAGLSSKSIFKMTLLSKSEKMQEYHKRLEHAKGSGSDAIAILNVYQSWREKTEQGLTGNNEKRWCNQQCVDLKNLRDMHELIQDIRNRLRYFHFTDIEQNYRFAKEEKLFTIKVCIAGAFYPNYFTFGGNPPSRDDYRSLNNKNPCTTVYLKGLKRRNGINKLYEQQIRQLFCDGEVAADPKEVKVHFDTNSERLQVEFKPLSNEAYQLVPGEVHLEVYKAVKLRSLMDRGSKMKIKVIPSFLEIPYATSQNLGKQTSRRFELHQKLLEASTRSIYPKLHHTNIPGKITHIINCGKFFFQPDQGRKNVKTLETHLDSSCVQMNDLGQAVRGQFLIVKHQGRYKRGKIVKSPGEGSSDGHSWLVYLIDFGSTIQAVFSDFFVIKQNEAFRYSFEMPPQCYECRLSEVIPSAIKCSSGWSAKSTEEFKKFIWDKGLEVTVVSFVDDVASVYLLAAPVSPGMCDTLNDQLTLLGYAQQSDDSYLSRIDQISREKNGRNDDILPGKLEDKLVDESFPAPPTGMLTESVNLDGPYSPLEEKPRSLCQEPPIVITVEASSVNSVLFDPYPFDGTKKLLVAASMSKRDHTVALHQTTMMPHLPGMAALLALIFSPIAEVRCTDNKNRYNSILAGLGCDDKYKSYYGEHDCLIDIDVELSPTDFEMINDLRSSMSFLMRHDAEQKPRMFIREKDAARNRICFLLNKIFSQERSPLGINMEGHSWRWNTFADIENKVEGLYASLAPKKKLTPLSIQTRKDLKQHAQQLQTAANINHSDEHIECRLCEERVDSCTDLQIHVKKNLHKQRLLRIRDETM